MFSALWAFARPCLVALLALGVLVLPAHAQRQLHVLLMACTEYADPTQNQIGPSCEMDRIHMRSMLTSFVREASWGIRLNLVELAGRGATRDGFQAAFEGIVRQVGASDTVMVYFTGHGVLDQNTRRPFLFSGDAKFMDRTELAERMKALRCKLRILLTDCCSNYVPVEVVEGDEEVKGEGPLRSLLLGHTGFTDLTAASAGQQAWATNQGGYFTNNLTSDMIRHARWEQVYEQTRARVAAEVDERLGKAQVVYAYSIAEPDGAAEAPPAVAGFVIADSATRVLSPAELRSMGLRDLYLARNEIYARHGHSFRTPFLRRHFEGTGWYRDAGDNERAAASLSAVERANVDTIKRAEAAAGGPLIPDGASTVAEGEPDSRSAGDVFAYSSEQVIPRDVLQTMSLRELSLARNEIYARHGYIFKSPALRAHFASRSWYRPRSQAAPALTGIEKANCSMIEKIERIKGGPAKW